MYVSTILNVHVHCNIHMYMYINITVTVHVHSHVGVVIAYNSISSHGFWLEVGVCTASLSPGK